MKKIFTLSLSCLLLSAFSSHAQIFWVENFGTCSTSGAASSYSGPNGAWSEASLGTAGTFANQWFVSGTERGHVTGACGDDCASGTGAGLEATLHLGSTFPSSDPGAAYWVGLGSISDATTDKRAESPVINCTGRTGITLSFYYIENGDGTNDDGTVYYYDGTTWTLLANPAKTSICSGGQGQWDHFSIALPASANNNPNVKIGFRWVNNNDGAGTDPSFAIDSMSLSGAVATSGPVASFTASDTAFCQDSCATFTSTTTGTTDSITWKISGVTVATPHATTITQCFANAGTFNVRLYAYHGTSIDSSIHAVHVQGAPHPVVTHTGDTFSVTGTYTSYQWLKNGAILAGATNKKYGTTAAGVYTVIVDSAGCKGTSVAAVSVFEIAGTINNYYLSQTGNSGFALHSASGLSENLEVIVFDATGRRVINDTWQTGTYKKEFNADFFNSGLYIIRLGNANTSVILKWAKQ